MLEYLPFIGVVREPFLEVGIELSHVLGVNSLEILLGNKTK